MSYLSRPRRGQQRDKPYREALRMELAAAGEDMKALREIAKVHIANYIFTPFVAFFLPSVAFSSPFVDRPSPMRKHRQFVALICVIFATLKNSFTAATVRDKFSILML